MSRLQSEIGRCKKREAAGRRCVHSVCSVVASVASRASVASIAALAKDVRDGGTTQD